MGQQAGSEIEPEEVDEEEQGLLKSGADSIKKVLKYDFTSTPICLYVCYMSRQTRRLGSHRQIHPKNRAG